jgi:hypothetical protein
MGAMAISVSSTASAHSSPEKWEGVRFLEFERQHWGVTDDKEDAVFSEFSVGLPAYYQRLYRLCRTQEALSYDAHLVRMILDAAEIALERRIGQSGGDS